MSHAYFIATIVIATIVDVDIHRPGARASSRDAETSLDNGAGADRRTRVEKAIDKCIEKNGDGKIIPKIVANASKIFFNFAA